MKKLVIASIPVFLLSSCLRNQEEEKTESVTAGTFSVADKKLTVYTTADTANYRLSLTDSAMPFKDFGQPRETEVCVFVDPTKTFQTFLGIGGAITDASAETFAKLPKEKQQEIMQAYYDPKKGIGYTLARTTSLYAQQSNKCYNQCSYLHRTNLIFQ